MGEKEENVLENKQFMGIYSNDIINKMCCKNEKSVKLPTLIYVTDLMTNTKY